MPEASEALATYNGRTEKKAVQKPTEAVACKQETYESLITQVFQLHSNILTEEAMRPWGKIIGEQI